MRYNPPEPRCRAALAGLAAALAITAKTLSPTDCAEPPVNCQLPDQAGHGAGGVLGATSDIEPGFEVVENFSIDAGGMITSACWWGFYRNFVLGEDCADPAPPDPDNFTIRFYSNDPACPDGAPLTLLATRVVGAANGMATGNTVGAHLEYGYTASFAAVTVSAGACTWISIQNDVSRTDCLWLWSTAPPGDGDSHQFGAPDPENDFDLAFCLNLPLGTIDCGLAPLAECIGARGDCGAAHANPGCDDLCCCTQVCLAAPGCCDVEWDAGCVDLAVALGCVDAPVPPCLSPAGCQLHDVETAFNSTPGQSSAVDDFSAAAGGAISELCWYGLYTPAPVVDNFRIRYFSDVAGFPGAVLAEFSQAAGTLLVTPPVQVGNNLIGFPIFRWNATHAPLEVGAGVCHWLEIANDVGAGASWFWSIARTGPHAGNPVAPPREGNARIYLDEALDGYALDDQQPFDLAFCLDIPVSQPACGFETLFDTGPHHPVLLNGAPTYLGFSAGNLDNDDRSEYRTAQAFTVPRAPEGSGEWILRQIVVEGFGPGALNETLSVEIFARSALDVAPTPADSLLVTTIPFSEPHFTTEVMVSLDAVLPPGDYWLTMWAANDEDPFVPSNYAWFSNAPEGINNVCTLNAPPPPRGATGCQGNDPDGAPPGTPMRLQAHTYPDPGFGSVSLPAGLEVIPGSGDDPADLFNTAFRLRGLPVSALCPWDCQPQPDGIVATADLLAMLGAWGGGGPCDFDGAGVGTSDLLKLLSNWGACPTG